MAMVVGPLLGCCTEKPAPAQIHVAREFALFLSCPGSFAISVVDSMSLDDLDCKIMRPSLLSRQTQIIHDHDVGM